MSAADTTAILSSRSATAASGCTIKNAVIEAPNDSRPTATPKLPSNVFRTCAKKYAKKAMRPSAQAP